MIVERKLQVDGISVHLREWGNGGMPVIFWHALGDHSSMQMAEAGPILVNDYGLRVVGIDAPGFGGSAPRLPDAEYEIPALTAFIDKLVDALELERPAWVGSSWGATLGISFGGAHPDKIRALVLLDGGYWEDPDEPLLAFSLDAMREKERAALPEYRWPNWEAAYAEYRRLAGRWSPALQSYVHSVMREEGDEVVSIMGPDVYAAGMFGILHADLAKKHERLGRTGLPVLLLASNESPELAEKRERSLQNFESRVPQADVRRIAAPHLMLEAQPFEVARIIGPWLRSQAAPVPKDANG